jgi:hypothetical protein
MAHEHWFDTVHKAMFRAATRREMVRVLALLLPGWLLGDAIGAAAKNKKRGGGNGKNGKKGKGKPKSKPKPKPKPSCSGGTCQQEFVLPDNREYCEFICRQCDADDDPRQFCIVAADPSDPHNPMKIAVCCDEGETCCGDSCCPKGHACCDGHRCCPAGATCCEGWGCCGTDNPYTACCDGRCVSTEISQNHCGACGNPCGSNEVCELGNCVCATDCQEECPPGTTWCGVECVNTKTDRDHCGGCFAPNPNGLKCCNGNLCTYVNGVCCGSTCYPEGWTSC